jgi:hypothetical protein
MWLFGASTVENVLSQGKADGTSASLTPCVEQMLRAGSAFRDLTASNMSTFAGLRKPQDGANDMLALMARASVIASVGGFRYWRKLAQIHAARQSNILRTLSAGAGDPNGSEEARRALAEEFRAYLREIGDISLQEARAFQSELEKLAADLTTAGGVGDESSEYRRRWKAKP